MMKIVVAGNVSMNNAYPLGSEGVPKHFRQNTVSLMNLCFIANQGKHSVCTRKGTLVRHRRGKMGLLLEDSCEVLPHARRHACTHV